ncbi:MAG: tetratricopeptide repeat protein, partial [Verrucomicrobiales bacterium]
VSHDEIGAGGEDQEEEEGGAKPNETRQIIDVFGGGTFVSDEEAAEIAGLIPALGESTDQYDISSEREIITRMLVNLKAISIEEQQPLQALRYVNLILALNPDDPSERLSRALLHAQADEPALAIPDLDWIFENEPEGIDLVRLREFYEHLQRQL